MAAFNPVTLGPASPLDSFVLYTEGSKPQSEWQNDTKILNELLNADLLINHMANKYFNGLKREALPFPDDELMDQVLGIKEKALVEVGRIIGNCLSKRNYNFYFDRYAGLESGHRRQSIINALLQDIQDVKQRIEKTVQDAFLRDLAKQIATDEASKQGVDLTFGSNNPDADNPETREIRNKIEDYIANPNRTARRNAFNSVTSLVAGRLPSAVAGYFTPAVIAPTEQIAQESYRRAREYLGLIREQQQPTYTQAVAGPPPQALPDVPPPSYEPVAAGPAPQAPPDAQQPVTQGDAQPPLGAANPAVAQPLPDEPPPYVEFESDAGSAQEPGVQPPAMQGDVQPPLDAANPEVTQPPFGEPSS